jgi:pullulanase
VLSALPANSPEQQALVAATADQDGFNWGYDPLHYNVPEGSYAQDDWDILAPALADPNFKPTARDIEDTFRHVLEMLVIRKTSNLFRLRTADAIRKSVSFYNTGPDQVPGLIVERIQNRNRFCFPAQQAVVLVNATPQPQTFGDAAFRHQKLVLHPVQAFSQDPVVRTSKFQSSTGTFTIPARTTAVFIEPCFGSR